MNKKVPLSSIKEGEIFIYNSSCILKLPHIKGYTKGTFVELNGVDIITEALVYISDKTISVALAHNLTITNNRRIWNGRSK